MITRIIIPTVLQHSALLCQCYFPEALDFVCILFCPPPPLHSFLELSRGNEEKAGCILNHFFFLSILLHSFEMTIILYISFYNKSNLYLGRGPFSTSLSLVWLGFFKFLYSTSYPWPKVGHFPREKVSIISSDFHGVNISDILAILVLVRSKILIRLSITF